MCSFIITGTISIFCRTAEKASADDDGMPLDLTVFSSLYIFYQCAPVLCSESTRACPQSDNPQIYLNDSRSSVEEVMA